MTYGNVAYDYDYYDREWEQAPRVKREPEKKTGNTEKTGKKAKNSISFAEKIIAIAVLAVAAISMIVQFVEVKDTYSNLIEKREQYAFEQAVTSQKSYELEQSIDLSKIESEAVNRLGMKRPDRHQIVYIDVPKDDVTEKTALEVEGLGNRLSEGFKSVVSHIIEFFSI